MYTCYHLGSALELWQSLHHGFTIVVGGLHDYAYAEEGIFAAAVEADNGGLQARAVQLLGFAFGAQEEGSSVQLVEVQGVGQFQRLLLEVVVDLILVVVDGDLAWRS